MTCLRPATSGFIVTLTATILLAVVVFSVPYAKSVYFLKAAINQGAGNITFGTLGYCVELPGNTTCSKPSIGYQLDINGLVGNTLPVKIPEVAVKWLTYALFIHVVALVAAAVSALFGLLAHVREMSMTCCSICFSGLGASITFIALIFDFVLFFVAKKRINDIGSAQIGSAIWLTLVALVLLFFSGCFYAVGIRCMKGRPSKSWLGKRDAEHGGPDKAYAEQMRLDAVKAEADRKARQKQGEVGLPAFDEHLPLTGHVVGDEVHFGGDKPDSPPPSANIHRGYVPGRMGTRAVDDYHRDDSSPASSVYPPQREVRRQQSEYSAYSVPTTTASPPINNTRPSGYGQYNNAPTSTSPPPSNNQLLVPHQRYNSNTPPDPYEREYGHTAGGTSYHTAISHDQGPSSYGQPMNDPYAYQPHQTQQYPAQSTYQANPYMTAFPPPPVPQPVTTDYFPPMTTSTSPPPIQQPQPLHGDRSYTLGGESYGGDGYGSNQLPPLPEHQPSLPPGIGAPSYLAFDQQPQHQLPPIDTNVEGGFMTGQHFQTTSPGPIPVPNDSPPGYESDANWSRR